MKGYCIGCGVLLTGRPDDAHYCLPCNRKLRSIHNQVGAIMRQAGLSTPAAATCVDCGKAATLYDHRYYSRPLDVVPVCKGCNHKRGPARDVADVIRNGLLYRPQEDYKPAAPLKPRLMPARDEFERQAIIHALECSRWNRTAAARFLGITFRALRYRMAKLNIA